MPDYIHYSDSIETILPDEPEVIGKIVQAMSRETDTVAERERHAVRSSHAKSTGVLKGELRVLEGLPKPLAQGVFAQVRTYPAVVRFAQGPGERLKDSVSTHRGMAIKVFDVAGDMLPGHDGTTQDFVLATGPVFPNPDAAGFLGSMK